jgi:pimeloyl-ACP methyl ester carboxylesterase
MGRIGRFKKWLMVIIIIVFALVYIYDIVSIRLSYRSNEELVDPDSKFIEVNGISIHYKIFGSGDRTILLIHGFDASTFSFRDVVGQLSKYGKVVVFDLPGFGLTERSKVQKGEINPYSRIGQVEITKSFIKALNLGKVIIIGHSMGGTIATIFAIRYPEMVDKLVLEDAAIFETGGLSSGLLFIMKSPIGKFLFPLLVKPMVKSLESVIYKAYYDPSNITDEVLAGYKKSLEVQNWDKGFYEILIADNRADFIGKISEINIPVLVITGKNDTIIPEVNAVKLSSMLKDSRLIVIDYCGHIPHEEKPEVFIHAVQRFLEGVWP